MSWTKTSHITCRTCFKVARLTELWINKLTSIFWGINISKTKIEGNYQGVWGKGGQMVLFPGNMGAWGNSFREQGNKFRNVEQFKYSGWCDQFLRTWGRASPFHPKPQPQRTTAKGGSQKCTCWSQVPANSHNILLYMIPWSGQVYSFPLIHIQGF